MPNYSTLRQTDIAKMVESFIDSNEDDLSPNLFQALDELAGDIDNLCEEIQELDQELKDDARELMEKVEQLEKEIEKLESDDE